MISFLFFLMSGHDFVFFHISFISSFLEIVIVADSFSAEIWVVLVVGERQQWQERQGESFCNSRS